MLNSISFSINLTISMSKPTEEEKLRANMVLKLLSVLPNATLSVAQNSLISACMVLTNG